MWLVTTRGFFSVVAHRDDLDKLLIRARSRGDLENLCELADMVLDDPSGSGLSSDEIIELPDADYRYRLITSGETWAEVVGALTAEIDYPNFKSAIGSRDPDRAHLYMDVWSALREIQEQSD